MFELRASQTDDRLLRAILKIRENFKDLLKNYDDGEISKITEFDSSEL